MNLAIKTKWVAALRSGEYEQGTGELMHTSDESDYTEHCCLGVLTSLYAKEHNLEFTGEEAALKQSTGNGAQEYLCLPVIEWAGLTHYNPEVKYQGEMLPLSCLNDGQDTTDGLVKKHNFHEIADLIEAQL